MLGCPLLLTSPCCLGCPQVSRLSSELQIRDKQLGEQRALLKQVAEALESQKQTNSVSKQLHQQRIAELSKVAEQVGRSGCGMRVVLGRKGMQPHAPGR